MSIELQVNGVRQVAFSSTSPARSVIGSISEPVPYYEKSLINIDIKARFGGGDPACIDYSVRLRYNIVAVILKRQGLKQGESMV